VLLFVCDVIKDTGKDEYLRPFIRIGLAVSLTKSPRTASPSFIAAFETSAGMFV